MLNLVSINPPDLIVKNSFLIARKETCSNSESLVCSGFERNSDIRRIPKLECPNKSPEV